MLRISFSTTPAAIFISDCVCLTSIGRLYRMRRKSRTIKIGDVAIGGDNPVVVQSMTNTDTRDVDSTVRQIQCLEQAGCELVRVAVVDEEAARSIKKIKSRINIPLIADIHFDYHLALKSVEAGADGLRIN